MMTLTTNNHAIAKDGANMRTTVINNIDENDHRK